jgi:hypothetical protein
MDNLLTFFVIQSNEVHIIYFVINIQGLVHYKKVTLK